MNKFYLESFGCKFNKADSELIRKILTKKGFEETSEKEADFVVLNTCGVVEKTERKIIKRAIKLKKKGKKIIFAGCLPLISQKVCQEVADGLIGSTNILDLPRVVRKVLKGEKVKSLKQKSIDKAKLRFFTIPKETVVAIVPISEGCLGTCSYCATKLAKGKLRSFNKKEILKNIEEALKFGAKEIQLTSQDLGIYGLDKGKFLLPELLEEILKIKGEFRVRLGMTNPTFFKKIQHKIFNLMKNEKIYKFLHLPLQSGSDEILKAMKRGYNTKEFLEIVKNFRKNFKLGILATDVICAFPGETEKDFQKTVSLIKKIKPEILHVFRFSKRKGTEAEKLKDFPDRIKKERSRILNKVWLEILKEKNKKYLGKVFPVLITEKRKDSFLARTNFYKAVILKEGNLGEFKKVKIVGSKPNYLIGKVIN
jgi:threonylcarbamoyladenosine tRNA methylthiotransferase CDKAL1